MISSQNFQGVLTTCLQFILLLIYYVVHSIQSRILGRYRRQSIRDVNRSTIGRVLIPILAARDQAACMTVCDNYIPNLIEAARANPLRGPDLRNRFFSSGGTTYERRYNLRFRLLASICNNLCSNLASKFIAIHACWARKNNCQLTYIPRILVVNAKDTCTFYFWTAVIILASTARHHLYPYLCPCLKTPPLPTSTVPILTFTSRLQCLS